MKQEKNENKIVHFSDLMCVNEITSCTFSDNYVYSQQVPDGGKNLQHIEFPYVITPKTISLPASAEFKQLPPGSPGPLKAVSEVLCVFRI